MNKAVKSPRPPQMGRPMRRAKKGTFKRLLSHSTSFRLLWLLYVFS